MVERDPTAVNESRDRTVRWMLWASLAVGLVPIVAALAVVLPTLGRLSLAGSMQHLEAELTLGRSAAGEQLRAVLSRGASGIARVVGARRAEAAADVQAAELAADDVFMSRLESSIFAGAGRGCIGLRGALGSSCADATTSPADAEEPPLQLVELGARRSSLSNGSGNVLAQLRRETARASDQRDLVWRAREEGVYVRELGAASLEVAGALAADHFDALRPIEEIGVGAYLSGAPELHYGALSGRAAGEFSQGRWRLRPELDIGASYLALDKVRLDAGEAGLFLPETDDWIFSARPSLAFEGEIEAMQGVKVLPRLRAGATWLSQDEYSVSAMMLGMPATVAGVAAITPIEETFADLEAGLGIAASDRIQLSVRYGRLFGEAFETQTGRLELNMQF